MSKAFVEQLTKKLNTNLFITNKVLSDHLGIYYNYNIIGINRDALFYKFNKFEVGYKGRYPGHSLKVNFKFKLSRLFTKNYHITSIYGTDEHSNYKFTYCSIPTDMIMSIEKDFDDLTKCNILL